MNRYFFALLLLLPIVCFTQEINWKYKTSGPIISSPVLNDHFIYFGGTDSSFYCVDAETGLMRWRIKTGGEIRSTPAIYNHKLYFLSGDGFLYCINEDAKTEWKFATRGEHKYELFTFADYFQSSPVCENGIIYFGSGDSSIYAVTAESGRLLWTYKTNGIVHTKPCIYGNKLFTGSFDGWFYALDKTTGRLVWKFKSIGQQYFPKGEFNGSATAFNGTVYVGGRDYNLYALDAAQPYCHWNIRFQKGWAITQPVLSDSVLYIGTSDDRLFMAINPVNGNVRWKFDARYNIFGSAAVKDSIIYFGTMMGHLYGLNKRTGVMQFDFTTDAYRLNKLKYFKSNDTYRDDIFSAVIQRNEDFLQLYIDMGGIISQPLIYKNKIICTSMDGTIYCINTL